MCKSAVLTRQRPESAGLRTRPFLLVNLGLGVRVTGVNHGIAALVPVLRRHGYRVAVLHIGRALSVEDFRARVGRLAPSMVGFSATSHQTKYLVRYAQALDGMPLLRLAGGVHPSLDPGGTLRDAHLDGVCVGEGEIPLDALLSRLAEGRDPADTPGWWWRVGKEIRPNPVPAFVSHLAELELPDYAVFERSLVVRPWSIQRSLVIEREDRRRYLEVMLSRGCPHRCHYCCNHALRSIYPGDAGYFRLPPVERALELLERLRRDYPEAEHIDFIDDLLIADPSWFLRFSAAYARQIGLPYRLCGRFEYLTSDVVQALAESGCVRVLVGLESGHEELRRTLLNRSYTNQQAISACLRLKAAGIPVCTLNMLGLPGETREQMAATLALNRALNPEFGTVFYFCPYPGTKLYELCQEQRLLKPDQTQRASISNYLGPSIRLTRVSEGECRRFRQRLVVFFFFQTARYRLLRYWQRRTGLGRLGLPVAAVRLGWMGMSVWLRDLFHGWRGFQAP
jgi:anaerobic magnesium-protoporphyrin IX monomethyl ester cyclase